MKASFDKGQGFNRWPVHLCYMSECARVQEALHYSTHAIKLQTLP